MLQIHGGKTNTLGVLYSPMSPYVIWAWWREGFAIRIQDERRGTNVDNGRC